MKIWKLGKFKRKANRRIGGVYVTDHFIARSWSVTQSFTDPTPLIKDVGNDMI